MNKGERKIKEMEMFKKDKELYKEFFKFHDKRKLFWLVVYIVIGLVFFFLEIPQSILGYALYLWIFKEYS